MAWHLFTFPQGTTSALLPCALPKRPCECEGFAGEVLRGETQEALREAFVAWRERTLFEGADDLGALQEEAVALETIPFTAEALASLTPEERGSAYAFEAARRRGRLQVGRIVSSEDSALLERYGLPSHHGVYGQEGVLSPAERKAFRAFCKGLPKGEYRWVRALEKAGCEVRYRRTAPVETYASSFQDTFSPHAEQVFVTFAAVLVNPTGEHLPVPVSVEGGFSALVQEVLRLEAPEEAAVAHLRREASRQEERVSEANEVLQGDWDARL